MFSVDSFEESTQLSGGTNMGCTWKGWSQGREPQRGYRARKCLLAGLAVCVVLICRTAHAQCPSGTGICSLATQETDCNDGNFCTLDFCLEIAPPGPAGNICDCSIPKSCDDNLYCTIDSCNETLDQCEHSARSCPPATPFCDEDSDSCVECLVATNCPKTCFRGTAPGATCTTDANCGTGGKCLGTCSPSNDCVQCTNSGQCSDGLYCDGSERCDRECVGGATPGATCDSDTDCGAGTCTGGTFLCEAGTPVSCPKTCFMGTTPGASCTVDANCGAGGRCLGYCNDGRAACVQCKAETDCDNGTFCDGAETCVNDLCVTGTNVVCKKCVGGTTPGSACEVGNPSCGGSGTCTGTVSFCDEAFNRCQVCLTDNHCNDGLFCTADDCTEIGSLRLCNNNPDPEQFCDDGQVCNGQEDCNATNTDCVDGTPLVCEKNCFLGADTGEVCTSATTCAKVCVGGTNHGNPCNADPDCPNNGRCGPTTCLGSCVEPAGCVQCVSAATCDDGLFCNGTETCSGGQCVAGTAPDCTSFGTAPCSQGICNENTNQCVSFDTNNGANCEDNNHCTASQRCSGGLCVNNPPAANDPYRCVGLRLLPANQPVTVGSTVLLSLQAFADGCNTASENCPTSQASVSGIEALISYDPTKLDLLTPGGGNPPNPQDHCNNPDACNQCQTCSGGTNPNASCLQQCVGGANHSELCFNANHCPGGSCSSGPVCLGGSNNGNSCTTSGQCPGGSCNFSGKCTGGGTCSAPTAYNSGSSLYPNDCNSSQVNNPCPSLGFPGSDGLFYYQSLQHLTCLPACISTAGINYTQIRFKVRLGATGQTTVSLQSCGPEPRRTGVQGFDIPPSGYTTDDLLKSTANALVTIVPCDDNGDCNDGNACTVDTCFGNTCNHTPMSCLDADPCSIDYCSNGTCFHDPVPCDAGEICYQGLCYDPCSTTSQCDDGIACTLDNCDTSPPPPVDGVCRHTPDDSLCPDTFCAGKRCDIEQGCIFDHECFSSNGNPCPVPSTCDQGTPGTCGGCFAPQVAAGGCRHLLATPAAQGTTPIAVRVIGKCNDSQSACVAGYVQSICYRGSNNGQFCNTDLDCPKRCTHANGTITSTPCTSHADCNSVAGTCDGNCDAGPLGPNPYYKQATQWGTAKIRGAQIRPGRSYFVQTECILPGGTIRSAGTPVTTWIWGDQNGDGMVNVTDISNVVNAFKNIFGPFTFEQCNFMPGIPDKTIDVSDIAAAVDAFKQFPYAYPITCP